jgi:hypothetical protein
MNLRFLAASAAYLASAAVAVVGVALVIGSVVPGNVRKDSKTVPPLFVSPTADAVVPEPAPPPLAESAPAIRPDSGRSVPTPATVTGSLTPPVSDDQPVRSSDRKGGEDVVLGRPKAENPLLARASRLNVAAISPRAGDALAPGQLPPTPPVMSAPLPPRPLPERRSEGMLTVGEIRRIKAALRLTVEQERYWPPVEALLYEIATQQNALVQSGRPPTEAFGIGMKLRAYSATRPLLGVLQEEQKAEIRRRARAMGFDAVASAI